MERRSLADGGVDWAWLYSSRGGAAANLLGARVSIH